MKTLTYDLLTELLHYDRDTGVFTWKSNRSRRVMKGDRAGTLDSKGYIQIGIKRTLYLAHRLAWMYIYGEWPKSELDHINRIRDDNRISNLRLANRTINTRNLNLRCDNKSGVTGVWRNQRLNKWQAYIRVNNKHVHLGVYGNFDDAVKARKTAEQTLWSKT